MHHRPLTLSLWLGACLIGTACSSSEPQTQNIIIAPEPAVTEPLGTEAAEMAATTLFVSRGAVNIAVEVDGATHTLRGPLLQGAVRTTDLNGLSDATGEFDVISEGWRCEGCDALVPIAREALFPTGRAPYVHMTLVPDGTGMVTVEWTGEGRSGTGRFAPTVSGPQRDLTVDFAAVDPSNLFTSADKRALARALGVRQVEAVTMTVELHLTNDPVRAGASSSARITTPVDDGNDRPIWEELPSRGGNGSRGSMRTRGANYQTRAALEGGEPTPEFVDETGR